MSPFCLRLQHRAASPAHSDGEVKEKGPCPTGESSGLDSVKWCQMKQRML